MPIEVRHTPVGTLMNLSRVAGEEQQRRESAAGDLAFTQMALSAQTQNNQIAATMQRNDQAFQLQQAAIDRQSRTATRAATARGPVVQEFDSVLGRMKQTRAWGQEDQTRQLQQLTTIPGLSDRERESIKLGIMGGQPLTQLLKERQTKPERIGLTPAQIESRKRTLYNQERGDYEAERDRILEESSYADFTGADRVDQQKRLKIVTEKIQVLDAKYRGGATGDVAPGTPSETGQAAFDKPQSLPNTEADLVVGQTYMRGDGKLARWTGSRMVLISDGTRVGAEVTPEKTPLGKRTIKRTADSYQTGY